jgi:hypothetical protein
MSTTVSGFALTIRRAASVIALTDAAARLPRLPPTAGTSTGACGINAAIMTWPSDLFIFRVGWSG